MKSIFFDLETSDLNFVGQIINYAFVHVDRDWKVLDKLHGTIKISNLQLPSPYAILANRVDLIEHQKNADTTEPYAMVAIKQWLDKIIENEREPTRLIGYNSTRFDVPFLRTSMLRNGVNPYHSQMQYGDLLHVVQKIAAVNPSFNAMLGSNKSLKLERICQLENLIEGKQKHESLDDVLLTVKLAENFAVNYGIDVRVWNSYEATNFEKNNTIVLKVFPEKDAKYQLDEFANNKTSARMVALDVDKKYALWIDIDLWKEGKNSDAVSWYSKQTSNFFVDSVVKDPDADSLAIQAKEDLSLLNLGNFFPPRNCDVEQFIYMMSFNENRALSDAIWRGNINGLKNLKSKFGSKLYLRHLMNSNPVAENINSIKQYAMYRYGGKMKVDKMDIEKNSPESFHTTYAQLLLTTNNLIKESTNKEDKKLLKSVLKFYSQSPIVQLAGPELIG